MRRIILVGTVACGKTTLCQRLNGLEQVYKKTQAVEVINTAIDTPGEYLEQRSALKNLLVASTETEQVLFVADPTQERFLYTPGQAAAFPLPVAGVISKTDIATEKQIADCRELLELTGADPIFEVSAVDGRGIDALRRFLEDAREAKQDGK